MGEIEINYGLEVPLEINGVRVIEPRKQVNPKIVAYITKYRHVLGDVNSK